MPSRASSSARICEREQRQPTFKTGASWRSVWRPWRISRGRCATVAGEKMTPRLYFDDPFLLTFRAQVVAHGTFQGKPAVVLDRTAFYPEAGGQMADHGILAGARVLDVQVDDAGIVHHLVEGALPPVDDAIEGEVDRPRRRLHMALHTGQHMLSRALADVAKANTVSARLGETECTIDVDRSTLEDREVSEAEDRVNGII